MLGRWWEGRGKRKWCEDKVWGMGWVRLDQIWRKIDAAAFSILLLCTNLCSVLQVLYEWGCKKVLEIIVEDMWCALLISYTTVFTNYTARYFLPPPLIPSAARDIMFSACPFLHVCMWCKPRGGILNFAIKFPFKWHVNIISVVTGQKAQKSFQKVILHAISQVSSFQLRYCNVICVVVLIYCH